ncbi:hypothetical protein EWM64_g2539 [Hericium alpestre]|uniref:Proteasome subunit alpha type 1 n=1 Tax=Hericium alpestre TaxID=135208 RepID=A0A4Z0A578_9AGAM|nr:hypothetical protein EWM64_g2539 [Hericium alpestre]
MNKNPFAPQPSYNPQQPPLPPGPPPPQPSQPDYSAYWAAAAAAAQPHAAPAYNVQWPGAAAPAPAAPPRPPPEQSSLYANYGYGGQQSFQWQQQQQQHRPPQAPFQHPQPHIPPPQPQPYNPYQPQQAAAFAQPYVPQSAPAPLQPPSIAQQQYAPPQQHQQQRQFFPQQQRQHQPPPQQQQQHFGHGVHHTPPQHLPPAKRPKYDSSGQHNGRSQQQVPPPPQPQFQPPPPPPSGPMSQPSQMGGMFGGGRGGGQSAGPPGRGGGQAGRGSGPGRGRGGNVGNNRGGAGRGRGGGMYGGGRGGGQGGQQLKGHGSRGNFGGNRDYGNRRGGSFTGGPGGGGGGSGPHSHQQGAGGSSFRGRGQGHGYAHGYSRGGRHDGGGSGSGAFGSRDGMMSSSFASSQGSSSGKKEENRRTLTDFKIVGLEIQELGWSWSSLPAAQPTPKVEAGEVDGDVVLCAPIEDAEHPSNAQAKEEVAEPSVGPVDAQSSNIDDAVVKVEGSQGEEKPDVPSLSNGLTEQKTVSDMPAPNVIPPPPSRIRIYFHTPVSPDDSRPIPHGSGSFSLSLNESAVRKGKRKKLEDDDGDLEERRAPPPPPGGHHERALSTDAVDRHSAAPSIAETASEGDWLMAAIVEDEGDDADGEDDLHVTQIEPQDGDGQPTGDGEPMGEADAKSHTAESEDGNIGGADDSDLAHNHAGDTGLDVGERGESSVPEDPPGLSEGQAFDSAHDASAALTASAGVVDQLFSEGRHGSGSGASSSDTAMTAPETAGAIPHPEQQVPAPSAPSDAAAAPDDHKDAPVEAATDLAPVGSPAAAPPTSASPAGDSVVAPSHEPAGPVIAPPELALPAAEPSADTSCSPDTQVPPSTQPDSIASSVEAESLPATQEISFNDDQLPTRIDDDTQYDSATQVETQIDEQPSADTSAIISNTSTISTYGELNQIPVKTEPQVGVRTPSANRLSISYAGGSKRLVIDAEIVESLKVFRAESRIEVRLKLDKDGSNGLHGVLVESLSDSTKSYAPLEVPSPTVEADPTVPPFSKAVIPTTLLLLVHLDRERPLSEPKWVKSGDVQEWLKSMFGRMFWVAGDAAEGWEKKIEVIDPDPAPTIWTVLDGWAQNSTVGTQTERQRFLRTHMIETDNILEILLRLVRGERATPFSQSAPAISATSISGPLLNALSQGSAHGAQQTHVSLAVLAMFRMAVEYAKKAVGEDRGKSEVEERVGEIIRCLPSHLLHKSLEGIFKEWKVEKKGGR